VTLQIANIRSWTPERIAAASPSLLACIQRIVDERPDEVTVAWLLGEVLAGRQVLWVAFDEAAPDMVVMAAFTAIQHYLATGYTFAKVIGLGGAGIDEALPFLDEIERWAKANGAQCIEESGREGWVRVLAKHGYRRKSTTLTKAL
jgi:hypothetical protein